MMLKIQKTTEKLIFTPSSSLLHLALKRKDLLFVTQCIIGCHLAVVQKKGGGGGGMLTPTVRTRQSKQLTAHSVPTQLSYHSCAKRDMQGKYKYSVYVYIYIK